MVLQMHATQAEVGWVEGIAYGLSFLAKVGAGLWSDITRRRTPVIALGISLTSLSKMLFVFAYSMPTVVFARCFDRLSKGVRSSPTDALIADYSHTYNQGTHYGVRQTLYTLGAVTGVLIAAGMLKVWPGCYRLLFGLAAIIAGVSLVLLFLVKEKKSDELHVQEKWHLRQVKDLPPIFMWFMVLLAILMVARFSEMFLVLRAEALGASESLAPMAVLVFEVTHALSAYPVGRWADKVDRLVLLRYGIGLLVITDIIMSCTGFVGLWIGLALGGLHLGVTQGLINALIAQYTPQHLRGTAFALSYLIISISILLSNALAGHLADYVGSHGPFIGGGVFAAIAFIFSLTRPWGKA